MLHHVVLLYYSDAVAPEFRVVSGSEQFTIRIGSRFDRFADSVLRVACEPSRATHGFVCTRANCLNSVIYSSGDVFAQFLTRLRRKKNAQCCANPKADTG